MDFYNGKELIQKCQQENLPISAIMKLRETTTGTLSDTEVVEKLNTALSIMKHSATKPLENPGKSIGGLIGGEAKKIADHGKTSDCVCGSMLSKAIAYSMAVLEVNASMGLIVAAPTAGSSGVVPGVLLALSDEHNIDDNALCNGLLTAAAIGYLLMRNSSVSGAEAGCQAEVGAASAMAAAAIVEIMGGTPKMCLDAASFAISNLLGLVCDPIAGLVQLPCAQRNASQSLNAMLSADLALGGMESVVPADEVIEAMYKVGKKLPMEMKETALGGIAATPTGKRIQEEIFGNA